MIPMQVLLSAEIRDKTVFKATWSIMNKPVDHLPIWLLTDSFYTLIHNISDIRQLTKTTTKNTLPWKCEVV